MLNIILVSFIGWDFCLALVFGEAARMAVGGISGAEKFEDYKNTLRRESIATTMLTKISGRSVPSKA